MHSSSSPIHSRLSRSHSWTAYSLTVDVAVPGADLASDLATLSQESDEFLTRHNELMALMSSYSGSWSQRAKVSETAALHAAPDAELGLSW